MLGKSDVPRWVKMTESLARALRGNLTYREHSVSDWDRLTAMALGSVQAPHRAARESLLNSLGVSLLGFKQAHRVDLLARASTDLRDVMGWKLRLKRDTRHDIASAAIKEWVIDMCNTCLGAGHVSDKLGVQRICATCNGSRKRRYSDEEREGQIVDLKGYKLAKAFDHAHMLIAFSVGYAIRQAKERLG